MLTKHLPSHTLMHMPDAPPDTAPSSRRDSTHLFSPAIALVSLVFGLVALSVILAKLHIQIPGTEIVTDPREVFVLLGAAIAGPVGGMVIGLLASLGEPNPQQIPYVAANHILGALWVGWAYRRLVFERFRMPMLAVGWLLVVAAYYFVFSIPVIVFTKVFLPKFFLTIVPYDTGVWETLKLMYGGWMEEYILTSIVTVTALSALPRRLREPLWGPPREPLTGAPQVQHGRTYGLLGLRLTVWFILLSLLPLFIIAIFLRTNLSRAFVDQVARHDEEIVRALAADPLLAGDPARFVAIARTLPEEYHTAFLLDNYGYYASHVDTAQVGKDARARFQPSLINQMLREREGRIVDDVHERVLVFAPLQGTRLTVVLVMSTRDALTALRAFETSSLVRLSAALLVLSGIAGVVIWLLVGRPLRTLTRAVQRIGQGDLEARVDTRLMEDEVAALGFAFNDMARDLGALNRGLQAEIQSHKATVEALRESEAKFRETADLLPQPIYEADGKGILTFANKAAHTILGYPSDYLSTPRSVAEVVAPEDRARIRQTFPDALTREGATGTEYLMLRADGTRFPALVYSAPIIRNGRPVGIRGIVLDITDRKQREEQVRLNAEASLRRQTALLELAQDAEPDYQTRIRKITATASRVLQVARVSVWRFCEGEPAIECEDLYRAGTGEHDAGTVLRQMDFPRYFAALGQYRSIDAHDALTDPRTSEFGDSYLRPNGITSMLDSVVWRGGTQLGVVCIEHVGPARIWTPEEIQFSVSLADQVSIAREIVEQARIQETLYESEARFRTIIEQFADGFVLIDRDATIIECNRAQEQMSGLPRTEILGMEPWAVKDGAIVFRFSASSDAGKMRETVLAALENDSLPLSPDPQEYRSVRPDGSEGFLQLVLFRIHFKDGNKLGAVLRDVTERRRAEERIRASLDEKELMLKEIHHRVKNNLQVISSLLSLQAASIRDPLDLALFRESEDRIRSMALIHEKLYQSKDFSRVDFRQYLESLVGYLFRSYRVADVGYDLVIDDLHLGINVAVPCGLILNELLTNALKHAFPGGRKGKIFVGLRNVDGTRVRLTVRDDGIGLPSGFDLERAQSLGMHLTRILAAQLDGTLAYSVNNGTAFEVEFPTDRGAVLTSHRTG